MEQSETLYSNPAIIEAAVQALQDSDETGLDGLDPYFYPHVVRIVLAAVNSHHPDQTALLTETTKALAALLAEATKALDECASELSEWVENYYAPTKSYPSEQRRYERDIEPVKRAREFLIRLRAADEGGRP